MSSGERGVDVAEELRVVDPVLGLALLRVLDLLLLDLGDEGEDSHSCKFWGSVLSRLACGMLTIFSSVHPQTPRNL